MNDDLQGAQMLGEPRHVALVALPRFAFLDGAHHRHSAKAGAPSQVPKLIESVAEADRRGVVAHQAEAVESRMAVAAGDHDARIPAAVAHGKCEHVPRRFAQVVAVHAGLNRAVGNRLCKPGGGGTGVATQVDL